MICGEVLSPLQDGSRDRSFNAHHIFGNERLFTTREYVVECIGFGMSFLHLHRVYHSFLLFNHL